jgi:hypothetical protein
MGQWPYRVGKMVGFLLGKRLGVLEGRWVGTNDGNNVGSSVGNLEGTLLGSSVGKPGQIRWQAVKALTSSGVSTWCTYVLGASWGGGWAVPWDTGLGSARGQRSVPGTRAPFGCYRAGITAN